ncbi:MAG TPA: hypothetical protein VK766_04305 [Cytophagaceae bacterium]|jgi:hypothetical protein|nr:hypothetical protein [Cytophagaceae bacterium]
MKTTENYLNVAHANDLQWKKDLEFYKDEIKILRNRLNEVSAKNTSKEIKMMVSHFENQFIINDELIDELDHEINLKEDSITEEIKKDPTAYVHKLTYKYAELKGKIDIFKKLFSELKKAFNKFLSETM